MIPIAILKGYLLDIIGYIYIYIYRKPVSYEGGFGKLL